MPRGVEHPAKRGQRGNHRGVVVTVGRLGIHQRLLQPGSDLDFLHFGMLPHRDIGLSGGGAFSQPWFSAGVKRAARCLR